MAKPPEARYQKIEADPAIIKEFCKRTVSIEHPDVRGIPSVEKKQLVIFACKFLCCGSMKCFQQWFISMISSSRTDSIILVSMHEWMEWLNRSVINEVILFAHHHNKVRRLVSNWNVYSCNHAIFKTSIYSEQSQPVVERSSSQIGSETQIRWLLLAHFSFLPVILESVAKVFHLQENLLLDLYCICNKQLSRWVGMHMHIYNIEQHALATSSPCIFIKVIQFAHFCWSVMYLGHAFAGRVLKIHNPKKLCKVGIATFSFTRQATKGLQNKSNLVISARNLSWHVNLPMLFLIS